MIGENEISFSSFLEKPEEMADMTHESTNVDTIPEPGDKDSLPSPPPNLRGETLKNIPKLPEADSTFPDLPDNLFSTFAAPEFLPPPPDMMFSDSSTCTSSENVDEEEARIRNEEIPDCVEESTSDDDDIDFTDADLAIDKMLDELQDFSRELSNDIVARDEGDVVVRLRKQEIPEPPVLDDKNVNLLRIQSIANVEDTPEVDLDALLADLCAMELGINETPRASLTREGYSVSFADTLQNNDDTALSDDTTRAPLKSKGYSVTFAENVKDDIAPESQNVNEINDKPSFPVRGMSISLSHDVLVRLETLQTEMESKELSPEDQEAKIKAEKIKIALEKMKTASFQELFIKVYNSEQQTNKTMMIDQNWTARHVRDRMISKDNVEPEANWCILERLPELFMERTFEDSEYVLQTVLDWGRNSENSLVFFNRRDKYMLFRNPQNFLLSSADTKEDAHLAEINKDVLLQEFFTKDSTRIPNTESCLWLQEGRKKWVKHYFSLRVSGIYYTPKGKQKSGEMVCLATFEHINVYRCVGFKKRFNAPTDYVFCIKHPKVQTFQSKHIYCICADNAKLKDHWITVIRMTKYGYKMYEDYLTTQQELESILLGTNTDTLSTTESSYATSGDGTLSSERKKGVRKTSGDDRLMNRVAGRQNALGSIFSTAWSKGDSKNQQSGKIITLGIRLSHEDSCECDE